jgi:hypothetical protein
LKRKSNHKEEVVTHKKLDLSVLRKYKTCVVQEWVEEGISANTQKKYGIRNDEIGKRWIIPIYDENNNLISLKARTYAPNWKEMGITKYIYYFKLNGNDILFGLNLILLVFNLFPIPPLDGSGIIPMFLSPSLTERYTAIIQKPAFMIIGLVVAWQLLDAVFGPVYSRALSLLYPGVHYG